METRIVDGQEVVVKILPTRKAKGWKVRTSKRVCGQMGANFIARERGLKDDR